MRRIVAGFLLAFAASAVAQSYPTRPVRVLVGFPPGGGTDIMARLLAPKLSEYLGQQYVVENRPGATTNIASAMVATAAPTATRCCSPPRRWRSTSRSTRT